MRSTWQSSRSQRRASPGLGTGGHRREWRGAVPGRLDLGGRLAFATMELVMVKATGGGTRQVTRRARPSSVGCPLFWPVAR
jgi:hypothetical protein